MEKYRPAEATEEGRLPPRKIAADQRPHPTYMEHVSSGNALEEQPERPSENRKTVAHRGGDPPAHSFQIKIFRSAQRTVGFKTSVEREIDLQPS